MPSGEFRHNAASTTVSAPGRPPSQAQRGTASVDVTLGARHHSRPATMVPTPWASQLASQGSVARASAPFWAIISASSRPATKAARAPMAWPA